jgi:uncharacterized protein YyaL (SSP411 family)
VRETASRSKPNMLAKETSPYLLQHAYNPVDWYPWNEESIEKARKEDKPIFLSVGYSACHWCHVMAHESFEDEDIARIMNEHFVNIKVDREERPDLDDIYQRVCQLATGTGGWPLSVFLTPSQKPFYVGTYFPKDGNQYGLPGFRTILLQLADAYKKKKQDIEGASNEFMDALAQTIKDVAPIQTSDKVSIERSILDEAAVGLLQMGDLMYGGFGHAPKFPNTSNLMFLLRYYDISRMNRFRDFVLFTADKMATGGIHDQLGGGFARYSTDQKWLVPHFEKMLYDNALLAQLYAELYQITKDKRQLDIVRKTLDFVIREMTHAEGGFYAAQDADSEGEEGKFYLWTKKEIANALNNNQERCDIFCEYYGVTEGGNFEGKNILHISTPIKNIAQRYGKTNEEVEKIIADASSRLFTEREKRVRPGRDEKILTSWNGLMISGFAKGYAVTSDTKYLHAAKGAVKFIETRLAHSDGRLKRTFKDGNSKLNAYLDDYGFYAGALLDLFAINSEPEYLDKAIKYTEFMLQHFWDEKEGNLFFTSDDHEQLIFRTKNFYDLAIPSGNSIVASNLLRLYHYTQNEAYLDKSIRIMKAGARQAAENPFGFGQLLISIYFYVKKPVEVTVIADKDSSDMAKWLNRHFLPEGISAIISSENLQLLQRKYAYFRGREGDGETAFVCRNFTCSLPLKSKKELEAQLMLS